MSHAGFCGSWDHGNRSCHIELSVDHSTIANRLCHNKLSVDHGTVKIRHVTFSFL